VIRSAGLVPRKEPALPTELADHRKRRTSALKGSKHQLDALPHLFVRVKNYAAGRIVSKSDRQVYLKLSAFGFVGARNPKLKRGIDMA